MTPEQQGQRAARLLKLHETVIDTSRSRVMWEWFSDGSGSSVFLTFWKEWWVLWYNNPEKAHKIHSHYAYCTDVLNAAKHDNKIKPIFEPVWMHPENSRPYLVRAIPGDTFSNYLLDIDNSPRKLLLQNFFWKFINPYLKREISELGFTDDERQFDIKPENILINSAMWEILKQDKTIEKLKLLGSQNWNKRWRELLLLLSEWYNKWARIYLFDYGTWIKPDGMDKYGNKVDKHNIKSS